MAKKSDEQNQQTDEGGNTVAEKVLVVVSSREGFRRAGHRFGKEPVTLRLADLTDEQVAMLKAEPMLVVTETEE